MPASPNPTTDAPPSRRSRGANIAIIIAIVLIAPAAAYGLATLLIGEPPQLFRRALPEIPPPNTAETLVIPFSEGEATSDGTYSGRVTLVIEGFGAAGEMGFQDAFYVYADAEGFGLDEPQRLPTDLTGDYEPPAYNPFHVYEVVVDMGPLPSSLTIRVPVGGDPDTTDAMRVYIAPEPVE